MAQADSDRGALPGDRRAVVKAARGIGAYCRRICLVNAEACLNWANPTSAEPGARRMDL
jgi:hypothetical protein